MLRHVFFQADVAVHFHVLSYSAATDANTLRFQPKHAELGGGGGEGLHVAELQ